MVSVFPILLKTLPMLFATVDIPAVAARAMSATTSAYSIRSCPRSSSRAAFMLAILKVINIRMGYAHALDQLDSPLYDTVHTRHLEGHFATS